MAGLGHHVHHPAEAEDPATIRRNARRGLALFALYLFFYAGFVLLNAFGRPVMERIGWYGVNFAVWYGFALIAGALLLALIYAWFCRPAESTEDRA
jgi:uncharacterized membrane protein (DUF485 family)